MPLYVYRCEACGVTFERRQSIRAQPLTKCPECGASIHRIPQPVGIVFKGSGFYTTDNRKSRSSD
jgi:putative FmdB family regulatory protein